MCYSTKLTQNSSFIKVRRNITRLPETADLLAEEGSTGFGTYIMILLYLTECPDCVGCYSKDKLRVLSAQAHKSSSYISKIINDYGLFVVEGNRFFSTQLCESMHIDYSVAAESTEDDSEPNSKSIKNDSKMNYKSIRNESKLNHESFQNQRNANMHNTYTHAQPREDIDIDKDKKDKRNSSSTTTNFKKDDVNANVNSSFDSIKKSFADADWVKSISSVTALQLTNETVAEACIEWFCMQCKAKGKTFETDENARWYFCNLLQPGRKTREAFDEYYQQFKYDEMVRKTAIESCEDDYYDYKDNGHRYDSHTQIIPPDAPHQIDPNTMWSWIKLKFIPEHDFNVGPEMVARSEYYEEYRRVHNIVA